MHRLSGGIGKLALESPRAAPCRASARGSGAAASVGLYHGVYGALDGCDKVAWWPTRGARTAWMRLTRIPSPPSSTGFPSTSPRPPGAPRACYRHTCKRLREGGAWRCTSHPNILANVLADFASSRFWRFSTSKSSFLTLVSLGSRSATWLRSLRALSTSPR